MLGGLEYVRSEHCERPHACLFLQSTLVALLRLEEIAEDFVALQSSGSLEWAVKVLVDQRRCQGHGECNATAPHIFQLYDDGHVAFEYLLEISAGKEAQAARAIASYPQRAVMVTEHRGDRSASVPGIGN